MIAPWIVPPNYLEAMRAGAGVGLQARAQDIQEQQHAEQLGLSREELQARREQHAAQLAESLRQHNALELYRQQEISSRNATQALATKKENAAELLKQQQQSHIAGAAQMINEGAQPTEAFAKFPMALPSMNPLLVNTETTEIGQDDQGRPTFKISRGGAEKKAAPDPFAPTTAFRTKLQEQGQGYDDAFSTLSHIEKNMNASDFGLRGVSKEMWAKLGGQVGASIDPNELDTRKALASLRTSLYKAYRSDSNISDAERQKIDRMFPSEGLVESLPNAVASLMNIKREIVNRSRVAASKLGSLPPVWAMTLPEIAKAFTAGEQALKLGVKPDSPEFRARFLTAEDAAQAVKKFHADEAGEAPTE